jgi:hypothetical protein
MGKILIIFLFAAAATSIEKKVISMKQHKQAA